MSASDNIPAQYLWDIAALHAAPATFPAPGFEESGVRALFYETLPWKNSQTRSFAYLGLPESASEKVPAMVLVHGGGGTADAEWVRRWTARGYAAIAMDNCGASPGGDIHCRPRHRWSGPSGWNHAFDEIDCAPEDQWIFHAVADVFLAHSLLRSLPEVDENRVGLTGISWGGFLACLLAGLDSRLQCVAPVYGCGFMAQNEFFKPLLPQGALWRDAWEPASYLAGAKMPMLWVNGTNDFAFPLDVHQKSYRLAPGERTLSIGLQMAHSQAAGTGAPEIFAFADHILQGEKPLAKVTATGRNAENAEQVWTEFDAETTVVRAELLFTSASSRWTERAWQSQIAQLENGRASAKLPPNATAWFFNGWDARGLLVSSEMEVKI